MRRTQVRRSERRGVQQPAPDLIQDRDAEFINGLLGDNSYLRITSLEDQAYQILNAESIRQWNGSTALFNGDALTVKLFVAPLDKGVFFEVSELLAGKRANTPKTNRSQQYSTDPIKISGSLIPDADIIVRGLSFPAFLKDLNSNLCKQNANDGLPDTFLGCNGIDERVPIVDPAVARGVFLALPSDTVRGATAWIISNGAMLTAGHTVNPADHIPLLYEFNVPLSDPDGTINVSHPDDQYPYDASSL